MSDTLPRSPLAGLSVVVTRAEHQAGSLLDLLQAQGAIPIFYPCISIEPPHSWIPLDQALQQASDFDWLVLTSANTVTALAGRIADLGLPTSLFDGVKVAVVGSTTGIAAQEELGLTAHVRPDSYVAEALAQAIPIQPGDRVLLPQSATARPVLTQTLTAAGAQVVAVEVYRTFVGQGGAELPLMLWKGEVDVITLTSGSTALNFRRRLEYEGGNLAMLQDVVVACIGPITAAKARELGMTVQVVSEEHTVPGLMAALVNHFDREKGVEG